ncbi:hypothetical protein BDV12DRAFT_205261 [Aspergillus spectabilis]
MFSLPFSLFQKPPTPLPHGWVQKWNVWYQRAYYVEMKTGRWQWEYPTVFRDQKMGASSPQRVSGQECDNKVTESPREYSAGERTANSRARTWAAPDSEIDQVDRIM